MLENIKMDELVDMPFYKVKKQPKQFPDEFADMIKLEAKPN